MNKIILNRYEIKSIFKVKLKILVIFLALISRIKPETKTNSPLQLSQLVLLRIQPRNEIRQGNSYNFDSPVLFRYIIMHINASIL